MATCFENKVLSCVHVETKSTVCKGAEGNEKNNSYISRFFFLYLDPEQCLMDGIKDDMTQISPLRKEVNKSSTTPDYQKEVISLEHKMATSISEVGFQVWSGALLLCDFLLQRQASVEGRVVLDLGAGPGLTSIVAAMFAATVICTDYLEEIVALAETNWMRNKELLPSIRNSKILFKVLDWNSPLPFQESFKQDHQVKSEEKPFLMSNKDISLLMSVNTILAAEVIYDDDLTDAFFKTIYHLLMQPPSKEVFISLEKRIVYSVHSHTVCSPAYIRFKDNLQDLCSVSAGPVRFTASQVQTDTVTQMFDYTRAKELELWKITSCFKSTKVEDDIT